MMEKTGSRPIDEHVRRAIAGDGTAFTVLWDTHILQLKAYLKGWLKQLDDWQVDDICSRSFEKAFRQIGQYDPAKSQFFTWLRSIAHNTALDLLEQEGRYHPLNQTVYLDDDVYAGTVSDTLPDTVDSPLDSIIRTENAEATERYIEALPELYREIARKRLVDGMQYREIAEETGIALNTVRTRLRRARQIIDKLSKESENEL